MRTNRVSLCSVFMLCAVFVAPGASAQTLPKGTKSGFVDAGNGVKIHYVEAGKPQSHAHVRKSDAPLGEAMTEAVPVPSILFVPGWTMPAWIWEKQIEHFSGATRVVAIDPRSQGESTKTTEGLYPDARARDIKLVVDNLHLAPVVVVGWSMAVSEIVSYVSQFGNDGIAGIVLVDGVAGLDPQMAAGMLTFAGSFVKDRPARADAFVRSMYKKPQPEAYLKRVVDASLATPTADAVTLLVGTATTDNRPNLGKISKPTLLVVTKAPMNGLFAEIQKGIPGSRMEQFEDAGHALFVDDADRFNTVLDQFVASLSPGASKP